MNRKRFFLPTLLAASLLLTFAAGCSNSTAPASDKPLKLGVTAGPHAEVAEIVKKTAEKDGLKIEIVEFSDYVQPNAALSQGDIKANSFQHQPYLDNVVKDRKFEIASVAKTILFPMGIYSQKLKTIQDLPSGAVIAIPNDPTNGGRALMLLEKAGLLSLKNGVGHTATPSDIVSNPKNLRFKELDAAQIPRSLGDLDLAAINTNYAMTAGLLPTKDALLLEDGNSPYANIIAVQTKDKNDPAIAKLIKAYQSPEVKAFVAEHFKGAAIAAW